MENFGDKYLTLFSYLRSSLYLSTLWGGVGWDEVNAFWNWAWQLQYTVTNTQDFGNYGADQDDITEQRKN